MQNGKIIKCFLKTNAGNVGCVHVQCNITVKHMITCFIDPFLIQSICIYKFFTLILPPFLPQLLRRCEIVDPCFDVPCENEGECRVNGSQYECSCKNGFTGSNCEADYRKLNVPCPRCIHVQDD